MSRLLFQVQRKSKSQRKILNWKILLKKKDLSYQQSMLSLRWKKSTVIFSRFEKFHQRLRQLMTSLKVVQENLRNLQKKINNNKICLKKAKFQKPCRNNQSFNKLRNQERKMQFQHHERLRGWSSQDLKEGKIINNNLLKRKLEYVVLRTEVRESKRCLPKKWNKLLK